MRRTKIVCTLGPASSSEEVMKALLENGLNVARLNFSHGTHEEHAETIKRFRTVRDSLGVSAAVLLDTKGPEIRIKDMENGSAELASGQKFTLTCKDCIGTSEKAAVTFADLYTQLIPGTTVLIDDGKIMLSVKEIENKDIICDVLEGGTLKSKKSINIPNVHIEMPYMSEKDKQDLLFGVEHDVDFVAASFVRCKEDVIAVRKFLDYHGGHEIKIISKIENIEGVNNFDEILANSDGIMVARGDMGVEVEFE